MMRSSAWAGLGHDVAGCPSSVFRPRNNFNDWRWPVVRETRRRADKAPEGAASPDGRRARSLEHFQGRPSKRARLVRLSPAAGPTLIGWGSHGAQPGPCVGRGSGEVLEPRSRRTCSPQRAALRFSADVLPRFETSSNSTVCPSFKPGKPARSTAGMWTKTSLPPSSGWMNPYPF
jgi:hypothetical protein